MKHFTSTQHFGSDLRQLIGSFHFYDFMRSGHGQHELSAHLRHDIGEDDVRPALEVSLPKQLALQANSVDAMILRAF